MLPLAAEEEHEGGEGDGEVTTQRRVEGRGLETRPALRGKLRVAMSSSPVM